MAQCSHASVGLAQARPNYCADTIYMQIGLMRETPSPLLLQFELHSHT